MSNEQQHDPTVTLRLELGRITDQRDAFKNAFRKEVLEVAKTAIYNAMLAADAGFADTVGCLQVEVDDLRAENARLKAEVERLTKAVMHSPVAQAKLKELEGKITFDEINPKEVQS